MPPSLLSTEPRCVSGARGTTELCCKREGPGQGMKPNYHSTFRAVLTLTSPFELAGIPAESFLEKKERECCDHAFHSTQTCLSRRHSHASTTTQQACMESRRGSSRKKARPRNRMKEKGRRRSPPPSLLLLHFSCTFHGGYTVTTRTDRRTDALFFFQTPAGAAAALPADSPGRYWKR